jgi:hypothetical protein
MKAEEALLEVVRELVSDVRAVGREHVKTEWPDLFVTYKHAREVLRYLKAGAYD